MPVYNTKEYLIYSLDSILYQKFPREDYELIIINDGSNDGSKEVLEQYAIKYSNIRLIHQENQGEAASRNKALSLAKGRYIGFVDSDDAIYENTLCQVIENAEKYDLDIQYMKIHLYDSKGIFIKDTPDVGNPLKVSHGLVHDRRTYPATLYKKSIIRNVSYPSDIIVGPDTVFNAKAQAFATKVSYISVPYYKYTYRENSLSKQGRSDKAFNGFIKAIHLLSSFKNLNFNKKDEIAENYFNNVYEIFVTRILELNIMIDWDEYKYKILIKTLKEENLLFILDRFSKKYPFSNTSFRLFKLHQKYIEIKSKIYKKFMSLKYFFSFNTNEDFL